MIIPAREWFPTAVCSINHALTLKVRQVSSVVELEPTFDIDVLDSSSTFGEVKLNLEVRKLFAAWCDSVNRTTKERDAVYFQQCRVRNIAVKINGPLSISVCLGVGAVGELKSATDSYLSDYVLVAPNERPPIRFSSIPPTAAVDAFNWAALCPNQCIMVAGPSTRSVNWRLYVDASNSHNMVAIVAEYPKCEATNCVITPSSYAVTPGIAPEATTVTIRGDGSRPLRSYRIPPATQVLAASHVHGMHYVANTNVVVMTVIGRKQYFKYPQQGNSIEVVKYRGDPIGLQEYMIDLGLGAFTRNHSPEAC